MSQFPKLNCATLTAKRHHSRGFPVVRTSAFLNLACGYPAGHEAPITAGRFSPFGPRGIGIS